MATRRTFNKEFMLSDNFCRLPTNAQLLYMHLALDADDEGFVCNTRRHLRIIGNRGKPLQQLVDNKLVHIFESGVSLILHWNLHNCVRKDSFHPTGYTTEKALVMLDENKIYRLKTEEEIRNEAVTET